MEASGSGGFCEQISDEGPSAHQNKAQNNSLSCQKQSTNKNKDDSGSGSDSDSGKRPKHNDNASARDSETNERQRIERQRIMYRNRAVNSCNYNQLMQLRLVTVMVMVIGGHLLKPAA
jgi:hypothetical protein